MCLKRYLRIMLMPLLSMLLWQGISAQTTKVITGKIIDSKDGSPVVGATVVPKGAKTGTTTDANGNFSLRVGEAINSVVVTSVGFDRQEVVVGADNSVSVSLKGAANNLNEVIVVGYGTQRRREVTGSIAKVNGDKLVSLPTPSFEASLQGRAPGVQVIQGSGLAGSGSVVRVRGVGSISAGGDPLYVIDGVPVTQDNFLRGNNGAMNQNPLAALNPNDIESIEVLKDAAAAGIYGSRGGNGVILVTTKRGKSGKPSFNYSNRFGFTTWANRPEFANSEEWLSLRQEAWQNDGNAGLAPLPAGRTWADASATNTDWWDLITRQGFIHEHNIGFNAGTKKLKVYSGASYSKNDSYIMGNSYERFGLRVNLDYKFNEQLKAGITTSWYRGVNNRVPSAWSGGLGDVMSYALPIYPVYKSDGSYWLDGANPYARMKENMWKNRDDRLFANAYIDYSPIKNLVIRATGGVDYLIGMEDRFETGKIRQAASGLGFARRSPISVENFTGNLTATYNYVVNDNHNFTFLVGTEAQTSKQYGYNSDFGRELDGSYLDNTDVYKAFRDSLLDAGSVRKIESNAFTFNSFFGRVNYNYKNKLYLQGSLRVDGSSKFGDNNKYGFFPSAALGYVITQEDFMENIKFVNFLKFRVSYGLVGNSNIPAGRMYDDFGRGGLYNGNGTTYYNAPGNPDLRWEVGTNFDLGFEYVVLDNRVSGDLSFYRRKSNDILLNAGLSPSSGFNDGWRNLDGSEIINQGVEFSLNAKVVKTKDFEFTVGGNISHNYNEVKALGTLSPDAIGGGTNDTRIAVGYPVGTNYLVRFHSIDPTDGLPIWLDAAGKQTKTFSLNNRVPVGSVIPDFVGGFNTALRYKGFEFNTLFTYTIGGNIYDGSGKRQLGIVTDWNIRNDIANRWRQPGDLAQFPRLTMNTGTYDGLSSEWQYNSTMFLHDASFLRLRELTFAYNFSSKFNERIGIKNARVFVTGMNLLTFSKYPGGDPEIARDFENAQDRNLSPNVTYLTAPQQKSLTFGINVGF
jgi:TonB-dependent starch-binding outer membrane protein SusC